MPRRISAYKTRDALDLDYPFIERLYIETMEPLLSALNAWDDERNINLFRHDYYKLGESKIIILEETDVGWMQVHHGATDIALHQLHLIKPYRGRKLGTQIIDDLLERARQQKKTVSLSVIKNNPAINLYQRLGFSVVGSDDTKIHMNS